MKVNLYPADQHGCGFYRMREPARVVAGLGVEVEIKDGLDAAVIQSKDGRHIRVDSIEELDCDVAVFQRPTRRPIVEAIPLVQAQGIAVVVEVDDDLTRIPSDNPAWATLHPRSNSPESWECVSEAVKIADAVTVGTPILQLVYGGTVLRNCVPERVFETNRNLHHGIGWAGAGEFHRGDFDVCGGSIAKAVQESENPLRLGANNADEIAKWLGLGSYFTKSRYWDVPVGQHYQHIDFEIGIVPLALSAFNQSKSWLKGLEYAALGIPFVASPTSAYVEWAGNERGGCFLADKPKDWLRMLRRLLADPDLRADMRGRGRTAAARWTFEARAQDWADAWEAARNKRRRTHTAGPTGRATVARS